MAQSTRRYDPLDDNDSTSLFDTPGEPRSYRQAQPPLKNETPTTTTASTPANMTTTQPRQRSQSRQSIAEAREATLDRELANVRNVNKVIEGVIDGLEKSKDNMDTVSRTVTQATTLLHTWNRILSQTEHNQRLILSPHWSGSSNDLHDIETQATERQQAEQRREMEERARKEAAIRKAEEEERRRTAAERAGSASARLTRGGRRGARGAASSGYGQASSSGYGQTTSGRGRASGTTRTTRTTTGMGRGTRGRGRGTT